MNLAAQAGINPAGAIACVAVCIIIFLLIFVWPWGH